MLNVVGATQGALISAAVVGEEPSRIDAGEDVNMAVGKEGSFTKATTFTEHHLPFSIKILSSFGIKISKTQIQNINMIPLCIFIGLIVNENTFDLQNSHSLPFYFKYSTYMHVSRNQDFMKKWCRRHY